MAESNQIFTGINPNYSLPRKVEKELTYYQNGILSGDRFVLSQLITLLESDLTQKRDLGIKVLDVLSSTQTKSIRVGITGSPGVGKSTFIESFGLFLISKDHHPAILAIDPSSKANKGSILGDKTRMNQLSNHPKAYIRPTASGNILGGTAAHTKECIQVCEAAGFDFILIETVGVGQSETEVDDITDVNLLLLQPGSGDDIQGIKRGIVENADIFIINKADGQQLALAKEAKAFYENALHLFHHEIENWQSPVLLISSLENVGMDIIYQSIATYIENLKEKNIFNTRRQNQEEKWFEKQSILMSQKFIFEQKVIAEKFKLLKTQLKNSTISTSSALDQMKKELLSLLTH